MFLSIKFIRFMLTTNEMKLIIKKKKIEIFSNVAAWSYFNECVL